MRTISALSRNRRSEREQKTLDRNGIATQSHGVFAITPHTVPCHIVSLTGTGCQRLSELFDSSNPPVTREHPKSRPHVCLCETIPCTSVRIGFCSFSDESPKFSQEPITVEMGSLAYLVSGK